MFFPDSDIEDVGDIEMRDNPFLGSKGPCTVSVKGLFPVSIHKAMFAGTCIDRPLNEEEILDEFFGPDF